jgi:hypothetical protein
LLKHQERIGHSVEHRQPFVGATVKRVRYALKCVSNSIQRVLAHGTSEKEPRHRMRYELKPGRGVVLL